MHKKPLSIYLDVLLICSLSACASPTPPNGVSLIENSFNRHLGLRFSGSDLEKSSSAKSQVIASNPGEIARSYSWLNGCSVALIVDAESDIVKKWYYLSAPEICKKIQYHAVGA